MQYSKQSIASWKSNYRRFYTAYATESIEHQVLNAGCQKYLTKPIESEKLLDAIVSLVESQKRK
jgi:CheY-like chemotaxis protein